LFRGIVDMTGKESPPGIHKGKGQFLLCSHPESRKKPRGCTRVLAQLVPDTDTNMITKHDRQWLAIKQAKLDKLE